jgi:circadian clock protein KaiC
MSGEKKQTVLSELPKARSGIRGLDEITGGGLPRGRPTLVCGGAGAGKTIFSLEFLVRGIEMGEPGVFMAFEETAAELTQNVASLGFHLERLVAQKKLVVDFVRVERAEIQETGEYDLEGLFVRLGHAIDSVRAKRVVLDTLESLFAGLSNETVLRSELRRLFRWLKARGVTAIVTAERGTGALTRQGLEEYVSDCVILLDHRVKDQVSTRRLRVVKYRGSAHGTNEYPFLVDETGFSVLPITSLGLHHRAFVERVSTGIPRLDSMLGGGYFRGCTVLVSGTAGSGKTSVAAHLVQAACARDERCLFFAFEESPQQLARNMRSIGLDLARWWRRGLLRLESARPAVYGLETHLAFMHKAIREFQPTAVLVDPITDFTTALADNKAMLTRLIDFLKLKGITTVFTSLTSAGVSLEQSEAGISSLIDTWIMLKDPEREGRRYRSLCVLKSRGMQHSHDIREFRITRRGVDIGDDQPPLPRPRAQVQIQKPAAIPGRPPHAAGAGAVDRRTRAARPRTSTQRGTR